jgi:hypothetical protein
MAGRAMISTPRSPDRRVRVAVIDSGVHAAHPHILGVAGGVAIGPDGAITEGEFTDRLGHGTAVMAVIQEKAPAAECFAVKVFDGALRATAQSLFRAIEWAIAQRVDIVNLSLGARNAAHAGRFGELVRDATDAGVSLVSAHDCYPGCLPGVIAVGVDESCDRDSYRFENGVFLASPYPRPAPGIPKERNLQGISFAVANMSGFAARVLERIEARSPAALTSALAPSRRSD